MQDAPTACTATGTTHTRTAMGTDVGEAVGEGRVCHEDGSLLVGKLACRAIELRLRHAEG